MMRTFFSVIFLFALNSIFGQTTYNFSTPATLSGSPWLSTATITIGGVSYTISGGINGGFTNVSSGGNGNSAALKKDGSGGDNFTIKRTDGKRFQFYNLWMSQSSMSPYPNTPPFYTIRFFNGSTEVKSYTVSNISDKNSTKTYTENIAITSVSVMFNALLSYTLDDLKVRPATPLTDAGLSKINLSKGALSPAFSTGTNSYTASVGIGITTLDVSPVASDPLGAIIKVNGQAVTNGQPVSVPLSIGGNTITIVCTAEDGTTQKTYTLVVNRSATQTYCAPSSDGSQGDDINSFTLAGETNTSIADNNTGGSTSGYDYRSSVPVIELLQGNSYNGKVTTNGKSFNPGRDGEHVKMWIDYNDDFLFSSNELIYNAPSLIISSTPLNFSISIPSDANPGNHRMRVRAIYEDPYNQTAFEGCSDELYGETHDYNVKILSLNPLPLTLVSLRATQVDGHTQVNWTTAGEVNVDKYEIEKSNDGAAFSKAGTSVAKNSSSNINYSWVDIQPMEGYNYYRLKMIDRDGNFTYSSVVKVIVNRKSSFVKVLPNPVTDHSLGLQLQNLATGTYRISLLDAQGQKVFGTSLNNSSSTINKPMQLPPSVTSGIYRLVVAGKKNVYTVSVIVK